MGTDPAPFMANLYLYFYESKWIKEKTETDFGMVRQLYRCIYRFIDDLCALNNHGHMDRHWKEIYPPELQLNKENDNDNNATFLDLNINIKEKNIETSLYDKRDNFKFEIVSMPDLTGNISEKTGYAVFMSQILRIAKNCQKVEDTVERVEKMKKKLMCKGYTLQRLYKGAKKCTRRNDWIYKKYNISEAALIKNWFP